MKANPSDNLSFEAFKLLAKNKSLSKYEKIGFPTQYRQGLEQSIFNDIKTKATNLNLSNQTILDVGCGCSDLVSILIEYSEIHSHTLYLNDSGEMLSLLPDKEFISKIDGQFPICLEKNPLDCGTIDVILVYSVIQYVFAAGGLFDFYDSCLKLLNHSGQLLIGDIPNVSMRKRFFSSPAGISCHQAFTGTHELPDIKFNTIDSGLIDDSVIVSLLSRARAQGFHAWLLPQSSNLPMANRREDLLIYKP
jgi:hypothetical protein